MDFQLVYAKLSLFFTDIDDCVNHTCANGGLCVDGVNSYSCNCTAGYTGDQCQTGNFLCDNPLGKCTDSPCSSLRQSYILFYRYR